MNYLVIQQRITNFFSGLYEIVSDAVSSICSRVRDVALSVFARKKPDQDLSKSLHGRASQEITPQNPLTPQEQQVAELSKKLDATIKEMKAFGKALDEAPEGTVFWGVKFGPKPPPKQ